MTDTRDDFLRRLFGPSQAELDARAFYGDRVYGAIVMGDLQRLALQRYIWRTEADRIDDVAWQIKEAP